LGLEGKENMGQSKIANQIKQLPLTSFEKEMIIGCLLGDGTLSRSGQHYRLRIEHSSKDSEYVEWKYTLLRRLCVSKIQYIPTHFSLRFGTVGHPEITRLREIWYQPSKQLPTDLVLTPLMVAIWFMDDGTKHGETVDFSVHSFSENSLCLLIEQLRGMYNILTTVNSDSKGNRLYVRKASYSYFKTLTKPYIIGCMKRKLP
jgi:hypothetical protein